MSLSQCASIPMNPFPSESHLLTAVVGPGTTGFTEEVVNVYEMCFSEA